jgi:hypothetical protein
MYPRYLRASIYSGHIKSYWRIGLGIPSFVKKDSSLYEGYNLLSLDLETERPDFR